MASSAPRVAPLRTVRVVAGDGAVTLIESVYAHPVWTVILLLAGGAAVAQVVRAVTEPLAPCRRGNCPRCRGTGSEERIRGTNPDLRANPGEGRSEDPAAA